MKQINVMTEIAKNKKEKKEYIKKNKKRKGHQGDRKPQGVKKGGPPYIKKIRCNHDLVVFE